MNDVLQRASKALREVHPGTTPGSGFTRARIMRSLHDRTRRRLSRWLFLGPVGALLLGSTAWAGATGQWPRFFEHASEWVLPSAPTDPARAVLQPARARLTAIADALEPVAPTPEQPLDDLAIAEVTAVDATDSAGVVVPDHPRDLSHENPSPAVTRSEASEGSEESPPGETPTAPSDPELAAFRFAHDLHFKSNNPSRAARAYQDYLDRYPRGRFVPEARYNIAVDLLRSGQRERAQEILQEFSSGRYGTYRKDEATRLLDALR